MKWPFQKTVTKPPVLVGLPPSVQWAESDVTELRKFLATATGLKLVEISRAETFRQGIANAADVFHTQHSAGITTGMDNMLKFIWNLSSDEMLKQFRGESPANDSTNTDVDVRESTDETRRAYH